MSARPAPSTNDDAMEGSRPRTLQKRDRILEVAMREFAERGYQATRVQDIAAQLGIAKASVFQHFGTKEDLFVAAFKRAAKSFNAYLDAPEPVRSGGFFATLEYWLSRTELLVRDNWVPYRVALLGTHAAELSVKREINRFLLDEDPYGTVRFVRFGIDRGEIRTDIDVEMIVALVDWLVERFQDALVTEELDPGLFRRGSGGPGTGARIEQFVEVLRSAIGRR